MKHQRGFTLPELVLVVGVIVQLAVICLGVYVIAHFVIKFW